MKKFLLMSTLCALALVGCKDDSEPEIPTDIDYSGLVLNEICGNDGNASEEDWIEIYNTSNTTINLNGVKLVKNVFRRLFIRLGKVQPLPVKHIC